MQHMLEATLSQQEHTDSSGLAIEITNLSKMYTRRKGQAIYAVKNLSLAVPRGQVFGFLGANGAGKTTTIKMICGLITPNSGRILVNGYDVARERSKAMRQIGVVLEGTRNVYWRLTVWQNLMYFGRLKGVWGQALTMRAESLLRDLELWERRNDVVRTFSRGMQQKLAIACSLIAAPPIVLLDEPTLGLDIRASRTVKEWVKKLAQEQGKTVILTTHQLDMAQDLCDRVAIISKGNLLTDQPLTELLHLFPQEYYQIRVKGEFTAQEPLGFEPFHIEQENGETTLVGPIEDQAALHALLERLYSLNYPLLALNRVEPNLEEVFMHITDGSGKGARDADRIASSSK